MNPSDFPEWAAKIQSLHETWCGLTEEQLALTKLRIIAWDYWLRIENWSQNDLLAVVVWLRSQSLPLEFDVLIEQPEKFAEMLAEARAAMHIKK